MKKRSKTKKSIRYTKRRRQCVVERNMSVERSKPLSENYFPETVRTIHSKCDHDEVTLSVVANLVEGHDEKMLLKAKTFWFFGEWEKLAEMTESGISGHPDRDRLALLVASAHQQLNNHELARKFTRLALVWGCSTQAVAQVLIAGVHNTLGKLTALKKDITASEKFFKAAINVGESDDGDLMALARSVRELSKIGLFSDASEKLKQKIESVKQSELNSINQKATIDLIKKEQQFINIALKKDLRGTAIKNSKKIVLIATIPRSGSTWLFNCAKLILSESVGNIYSCWVEDYNPNNEAEVHLVKAHDPVPELAEVADIIISTRRDIREVAASLVRMKWNEEGNDFFRQLRWIVNTVHPFWFERTSLELEYKQIIDQPRTVIEQVSHILECHLSPLQVHKFETHLAQLSSPVEYDKETLLHPNHRANEVRSFEEILGYEMANEITREFGDWLLEFGYWSID